MLKSNVAWSINEDSYTQGNSTKSCKRLSTN